MPTLGSPSSGRPPRHRRRVRRRRSSSSRRKPVASTESNKPITSESNSTTTTSSTSPKVIRRKPVLSGQTSSKTTLRRPSKRPLRRVVRRRRSVSSRIPSSTLSIAKRKVVSTKVSSSSPKSPSPTPTHSIRATSPKPSHRTVSRRRPTRSKSPSKVIGRSQSKIVARTSTRTTHQVLLRKTSKSMIRPTNTTKNNTSKTVLTSKSSSRKNSHPTLPVKLHVQDNFNILNATHVTEENEDNSVPNQSVHNRKQQNGPDDGPENLQNHEKRLPQDPQVENEDEFSDEVPEYSSSDDDTTSNTSSHPSQAPSQKPSQKPISAADIYSSEEDSSDEEPLQQTSSSPSPPIVKSSSKINNSNSEVDLSTPIGQYGSTLEQDDESIPTFSIGVVSASHIGATCFIKRFLFDTFDENEPSTKEIVISQRVVNVRHSPVRIVLYDLPAMSQVPTVDEISKYKTLFNDLQGLFLLYNASDRKSFAYLQNVLIPIVSEVTSNVPLPPEKVEKSLAAYILISTHHQVDDSKNAVSQNEGFDLARKLLCPFLETNSQNPNDSNSIPKSFLFMVRTIQKLQKKHYIPPPESMPPEQLSNHSHSQSSESSSDKHLSISTPTAVKRSKQLVKATESNIVWDPSAFEFTQRLGKGSFGSVFRAIYRIGGSLETISSSINKSRRPRSSRPTKVSPIHISSPSDQSKEISFAVKVLDTDAVETKDIVTEYEVLKMCRSPFIVNYFGLCDNYDEDELWIIMEDCHYGSVEDIFKRLKRPLTEIETGFILAQVVQGLDYLHRDRLIFHRDVKSANILVNKIGQCKLTDFGVSRIFQKVASRRTVSLAGTPFFISPEGFRGDSSFPSDIWSLGIVCFEMVLGTPPNSNLQPMQLYNHYENAGAPRLPKVSPTGVPFSPEFSQFVTACLNMEPKNRPTAAQLLKSPWLTKFLDAQVAAKVAKAPIPSSSPKTPRMLAGRLFGKHKSSLPSKHQKSNFSNNIPFDYLTGNNQSPENLEQLARDHNGLGFLIKSFDTAQKLHWSTTSASSASNGENKSPFLS